MIKFLEEILTLIEIRENVLGETNRQKLILKIILVTFQKIFCKCGKSTENLEKTTWTNVIKNQSNAWDACWCEKIRGCLWIATAKKIFVEVYPIPVRIQMNCLFPKSALSQMFYADVNLFCYFASGIKISEPELILNSELPARSTCFVSQKCPRITI